MHVPFLNLAAQFAELERSLLEAVHKTLAQGRYILGPEVAAFESELAAYTHTAHGIGVNSGSDALTLTLRALEIGPGDEVITTPFTYIAPAEAIHQMGARIVFADIDPSTFNLDVASVAQKVTARTKAILAVHLFGQMTDLDGLLGLAADSGIRLIEDCAQAIGARRHGVPAGSVGITGCFSFYPTKNLGAAGDGGMVVTNDPSVAHRLKMLRVHGIERRYYHDLHGFNSRLDEVQAAILRVKLPHLDAWNRRRQQIAHRYNQGLEQCPVKVPVILPGNQHVFHVYAVLTERRDALQTFLADNGVPTIIYYPQPLHLQKVYEDLGHAVGDFPVAEDVARKILPLPIYPELQDAQIDYVIDLIRRFFREADSGK